MKANQLKAQDSASKAKLAKSGKDCKDVISLKISTWDKDSHGLYDY